MLDQFPDYEASGDYFEVTSNANIQHEEKKNLSEMSTSTTTGITTTTLKEESSWEDDGVTCSESNITNVLYGSDLENHVLVIYKINVTANERELVL